MKSTPKVHKPFLIENGGQYLYYNKSLFRGGYYFKTGKEGAVMLSRDKARRVLSYLKRNGFFDARKVRT